MDRVGRAIRRCAFIMGFSLVMVADCVLILGDLINDVVYRGIYNFSVDVCFMSNPARLDGEPSCLDQSCLAHVENIHPLYTEVFQSRHSASR